jgi:hypothetical protein
VCVRLVPMDRSSKPEPYQGKHSPLFLDGHVFRLSQLRPSKRGLGGVANSNANLTFRFRRVGGQHGLIFPLGAGEKKLPRAWNSTRSASAKLSFEFREGREFAVPLGQLEVRNTRTVDAETWQAIADWHCQLYEG